MTSSFDCPVCGLSDLEFKFYGVSECNHPTCATCAIKLCLFSKNRTDDVDYSKCVICKQQMYWKIISCRNANFKDLQKKNQKMNNEFGLYFENERAFQFFEDTVQNKCNDCSITFDNVKELVKHVMEHKKRYCELCLEFQKWLPSEYECFNGNDYHQHRIKHHPKCKFCENRFYDNGHLIKHVKKDHFLCDICHRQQGFIAYSSQKELLEHYLQDHHVCDLCRQANHMNVFDSEYNLKMHRVTEHARSDLVSEGLFSYNYSGDSTRTGGNIARGKQGRGRGGGGQNSGHRRDVLEDLLGGENAVPVQNRPEIECEMEFPPLGAEGLGSRSATADENDTRRAFDLISEKVGPDTGVGAVSVASVGTGATGAVSSIETDPVATKATSTMADNVAVSVKKELARYGDDDFPNLPPTAPKAAVAPKWVGQKPQPKQQAQQPQKSIASVTGRKQVVTSSTDDYPELPATSGGSSRSGGLVGDKAGWRGSTPSQPPPQQLIRQHVPTASDFPSLPIFADRSGNSVGKWAQSAKKPSVLSAGSVASKKPAPQKKPQSVSNGGYYSVPEPQLDYSDPSVLCGGSRKPDSLKGIDYIPATASPAKESVKVIDDAEFQSLRVDKPQHTHNSSVRGFHGNYEKDFPSVGGKSSASGPNLLAPGRVPADIARLTAQSAHKHPAKGSSQKKQKARKNEPEPVLTTCPPMTTGAVPVSRPAADPSVMCGGTKKPESLKGIDYIPATAAPVKNSIKVIDADQFRSMKRGGAGEAMNSSESRNLSRDYEEDFPEVAAFVSSTVPAPATAYRVVHDQPQPDSPDEAEKPEVQLEMNSELEFPTLGSASCGPQQTQKRRPPQKQSQTRKQKQSQQQSEKPWTPPPKWRELSHAVQQHLQAELGAEGADALLRLGSQYRSGQLTSGAEFLERARQHLCEMETCLIGSSQQEQLLARTLPLMLTLLPDTGLQHSLKDALPLAWTLELRDCSVCGQLLFHDDMKHHTEAAHPAQQ